MVNTPVMIRFPEELTNEEREAILQTPKAEKFPLNLYLTADALAVIDAARKIYDCKDRHKALEILLRVFREDRITKGKKR